MISWGFKRMCQHLGARCLLVPEDMDVVAPGLDSGSFLSPSSLSIAHEWPVLLWVWKVPMSLVVPMNIANKYSSYVLKALYNGGTNRVSIFRTISYNTTRLGILLP